MVRGISGDLVTLERVATYELDWRGMIQSFDAETTLAALPGKVTVTTTIWPALLANSLNLGSFVCPYAHDLARQRGSIGQLIGIKIKAYIMLMRSEGEQAILIAPPVTT